MQWVPEGFCSPLCLGKEDVEAPQHVWIRVLGCGTTYPGTPFQGLFGKASRGRQHARPPQWLALTAKSTLG